jgi:hypothetical protein
MERTARVHFFHLFAKSLALGVSDDVLRRDLSQVPVATCHVGEKQIQDSKKIKQYKSYS